MANPRTDDGTSRAYTYCCELYTIAETQPPRANFTSGERTINQIVGPILYLFLPATQLTPFVANSCAVAVGEVHDEIVSVRLVGQRTNLIGQFDFSGIKGRGGTYTLETDELCRLLRCIHTVSVSLPFGPYHGIHLRYGI